MPAQHRTVIALSAYLVLLLVASNPVARGEAPTFQPITVIPKAFPAIKNAPVVSATQADRKLMGEELVLGVVIGDAARAYPINMLKGPRREIINDTLGDLPIAATW